tara:strand:- start:21256 stop:22389 length:1134 start_codon:yes stop_codon:yes gene_type:complete
MKEKSALFNLNKGYKSPLEGNAFGGKLKENMDKGMSKSDAAKQAAADLQDMPVDNRAGGSTPAANMNKGYGQQVTSPMSNLNKGYGQQVKSPLGIEDGIIIKGLRSIGSKSVSEKVQQKRKASGNFTMAELAAQKALKSNKTNLGPIGSAKNNFGPITEKQANYAANQLKPPTQIKSVGTSGVQNDGSGNEGYGVGGSTKKPVVKIKTEPIVKARKTVNALKTTSTSIQKIKTTGPSNRSDDFAKTAAATKSFRSSTNKPTSTVKKASKEKASEKIMSRKEIRAAKQKDKASGMSRKEVRLNKTKRKAAAAKAKTNKIAKSIDASKPKSADTGTKQIAAKSQRNKAKRLENRAIKIEGRIQKKKINKNTKQKIKSNI